MGQFSVLRSDVKPESCSYASDPIVWCLLRIHTTMKHNSRDLLVNSNGTVRHTVIISAAVNCEVNLFNYPFAADECPVAIQSWANEGERDWEQHFEVLTGGRESKVECSAKENIHIYQ